MRTQWRVGINGLIGLDYGVLFPPGLMAIRGVDAEDREDLFDCIKIMESAALRHIRETQK